MKRLTTFFHMFDARSAEEDAMGVTLDVLAGIVAGLALVLAIFMLASVLKAGPAAAAPVAAVIQTH